MFLEDIPSRGIPPIEVGNLNINSVEYWIGKGDYALEIVLVSSDLVPSNSDIQKVWKDYHGSRPAPVLLIVSYTSGNKTLAAVCGPNGQNLSVWNSLPIEKVERLSRNSLLAVDRHQSTNLILQALPELNSSLPGVINNGLFSTHDLKNGVKNRPDWSKAVKSSLPLLDNRGENLMKRLGFEIESLTTTSSLLRSSGVSKGIAVFLQDHEIIEIKNDRFNSHSPITYALTIADKENLPYVIITKGSQIRLYCTESVKGVGRRGRVETYFELNLSLLGEDTAGFLNLIFSSDALKNGGTIEQLFYDSQRFATGIGKRLRDRIYDEVIPNLATNLAFKQSSNSNIPTPEDLSIYYEQAMLILFRILFIAYAEDRDLLPYRTNVEYRDHSLQHRAERLVELANNTKRNIDNFDSNQSNLWDELNSLWKAVDKGNSEWGVPPYNGGLFSDDPEYRLSGYQISQLSLMNNEFGPSFQSILVDKIEDDLYGVVDFRSLSVREFGTIYEGLLESSLGFAEIDLTVDKDGSYIPASKKQEVKVKKGTYYLHNNSGERKASGSYFTKEFAVEHLLKKSLIPALKNHLDEVKKILDSGDESLASEIFFSFRCADISMGSGHFIIAAIDFIEKEMSNFLIENPLEGVQKELDHLRKSAFDNLKKSIGIDEKSFYIENSSLLRRQIARRCIYGIDINSIAVELSRLSVWIHTFVPGLPLSLLDRTLICGDSLTGIGTLEELLRVFQVDKNDMFFNHINEDLQSAVNPLKKLAKMSEANINEAKEIRKEYRTAINESISVSNIMDFAVGIRLNEIDRPALLDIDQINKSKELKKAKSISKELNCIHFPLAFPEVFLSAKSGFDCIIGNPPWEEVKFEARDFWTKNIPGLRSKSQSEQKKIVDKFSSSRPDLQKELEQNSEKIKSYSKYLRLADPNLGAGDLDLSRVFSWKFWSIIKTDGYIGVVLPRTVLIGAGMVDWRKEIIKNGSFIDTTLLINKKEWIFDNIHQQYTVSLTVLKKEKELVGIISTNGPYNSYKSYLIGKNKKARSINVKEFINWSTDLVFPLFPSSEAGQVYIKMKKHPKLSDINDSWVAKPVRELDATNDKKLMNLNPKKTDNLWPVYKGSSFNIWSPDTGEQYAWIEPEKIVNHLFEKRKNQSRLKSSAFYSMNENYINDKYTLDIYKPRISYRGITGRTNTRTVITSLIPPNIALSNSSPYLSFQGSAHDEAFLLGIMSSVPFDWVARRIVEFNLNFFLLNSLPIPVISDDSKYKNELQTLVARLTSVDDRFADWSKELGVKIGSIDSNDEKQEIIQRIDALVAHMYELDENDIKVIFESFHVGWDYKKRLSSVLSHFRSL